MRKAAHVKVHPRQSIHYAARKVALQLIVLRLRQAPQGLAGAATRERQAHPMRRARLQREESERKLQLAAEAQMRAGASCWGLRPGDGMPPASCRNSASAAAVLSVGSLGCSSAGSPAVAAGLSPGSFARARRRERLARRQPQPPTGRSTAAPSAGNLPDSTPRCAGENDGAI